MAGILDQVAKQIFTGFKGKLKAATLRRSTPGATLDVLGDPDSVVVTTYLCEGFTDVFSAFYAAQSGIPLTDIQWNVFAASLAAGITPQKDDQILYGTQWYQIRTIKTDPATALWSGAAFEIEDPV